MGIGTLNEGPLHASLKATYVANGGDEEVDVGGFVADAHRGGVLYEIQTGSFSGLTRKLETLLADHRVVLVHPIAARKTMIKEPTEPGGKPTRRRSPKRGALVHIVNELVYIPTLLNHPNFSVEIVLTEEEEVRRYEPKKHFRRRGWRIVERRLVEIVDGLRLDSADQLLDFVNGELPRPFTTRDLADALEQGRDIAQKMAYCLRHAGVVEVCGKQGNALEYQLV